MRKIVTIIFMFSCVCAGAQTTNYTSLGGPYGGELNDIIQSGTTLIGAVNGQGIVISTNNGSTWTPSNTGINQYYIYDLERDPDTGKVYALAGYRLFSSTDNGATWVTEATNAYSDGYKIRKTSTHLFIVNRYDRQVYRSTNGSSWTQVNTVGTSGQIYDFDVNTSGHLFITIPNQGVFRSTDNGLSFTQLDAGEGITDLNVVSFTINGSDLYVLTGTTPFKSTNNGSTWTSVKNTAIVSEFFYNGHISNFGGSIFIFGPSKAFVSSNAGTSWTAITHPQNGSPHANNVVSSHFVSATEFYVSFDDFGTFRTTDGGATWAERNAGVTGFDYRQTDQILIAPTTNRILMTRPNATGLFVSIDDGTTWDFLNSGSFLKRFAGIKRFGSNIYLYGSNGINRSTDNGLNFTEIWNGSIGSCSYTINVLAASSATNFYSYTSFDCTTFGGHYFLKSTDGGATWAKSNFTGLPAYATSYLVSENHFYADASGNIYALFYNYTPGTNRYELYKINGSTGAASYISNIPNGTAQIHDLDFVNNKLYVTASDGKIHKSSDGGATWSTIATGLGYGFSKVLSDNTLYFNTSFGTYISTDAGVTWVNTGSFGNGRAANDVILSATNFAYIAVDNMVLQKSAAAVIPPAAPTGLTVMATLSNHISIKWNDNSTNEDYFIIERSVGNNTSYDSIGTATRPNGFSQAFATASTSNAASNTLYYFRVRAKGAAGKSAYSNEVSTTTLAACSTPLSIPENRSWKVTTTRSTLPSISVPLYPTAAGVYIPDIFAGTGSDYEGLGADANVTIQCSAAALSGPFNYAIPNGASTWDDANKRLTINWQTGNEIETFYAITETSVFELNDADPIPAVPTNFSAYIKTANEIVVTWGQVDYASSYTVERATATGGPFTTVGTVNYPNAQLIDNFAFANGTTYYYRVKATSNGGTSAPTTAVSILFAAPKFEALSLAGYEKSTQGVGWIDLEGDGDEDLILSPFNVSDSPMTIFENTGNGAFSKINVPGISDFPITSARSVSVGDINDDGLQDFMTNSPLEIGCQIFINKGNKVFERKQVAAGSATGFNFFASFTDMNNDGRLDISFSDDPSNGTTVIHFLIQRPDGEFEPYELGELPANTSASRAGSWADIDNDNDLDFLRGTYASTTNDFDVVYKNNGGEFTKVTTSGLESDFIMQSRSVSWGDIDNDLDLDLFVSENFGVRNNMLFRSNGDGTFVRMNTSAVAETKAGAAFGSVFGDFDNDGDLDLVVGQSQVAKMYLNDGTGVFTKYEGAEYLVSADNNRTNVALATADYDRNGSLDIATGKTVNFTDFPTILLRNNLTIGLSQRWLEVKLKGVASNPDAFGARIIITTPDNKKQMRQIIPLQGWGSSSSHIAHFGLRNQSSANIEVRWPSGHVQTMTNVAANQFLTITEDAAGPVATARTPELSSVNNASTSTITLTLNEESIPQTGKMLLVYRNSDLATPIDGASVTAATKSGNTFTFTLSSKLEPGTQYNVSIDAGAFKDVYGNASQEFTTGAWTFSIAPAPAVTSLSPAHNATSVAVNTALQIGFDKTITAVAGKKLKVLDGSTTLVDIDVSTNGTIDNSTYSYTPASAFPNDRLLTVTLDAGAFVDASKQTDVAAITNTWTFTTVLPPDTQAPVITFDNAQIPDPLEKNFAPIAFSIGVTDNRQVGSAVMRHRKTGEKDFVSTSLTFNAANNLWEGSLPNSFVSDMGFEYFFEAADNATPIANIGRLPLQPDTYLKSKTSFKNNPPALALPSQGTANSWKIISIPYVFENGNNSASAILSSLGPQDKTKWRLLIYQSNPDAWNENIASIERGKGYFINTTISGASLSLVGAIAPPETRDNLFTMNLQAGWNQIGNPYTVAINLADVKNFNTGLANAQFVTFSNGTYSSVTQLGPFEGGFVNVPAATTIKIPFTGQTTTGGRRSQIDLSENIDETDWLVRMNLKQGQSNFELGYVGMALDANPDLDQYDMVKPPRFIDFIEMSFDHPEHVSKKFSGDVVPTGNSKTWHFTVDSNLDGIAELVWDNTKIENATKELFLLDVTRQVVVDMRKVSSYSFDPKESITFKVFFGEDLKITPESVLLGKAFPNPASGNTTIAFSLPDSGGHEQLVTLEILDATGRTMGTIAQGRYQPGFYSAGLQTNELTNGFYTYRLTVQNAKGRNTLVNKLIIK